MLGETREKIAGFGLVKAAGEEWTDIQIHSTVINDYEEDRLIDHLGSLFRARSDG